MRLTWTNTPTPTDIPLFENASILSVLALVPEPIVEWVRQPYPSSEGSQFVVPHTRIVPLGATPVSEGVVGCLYGPSGR